MRDNRQDLNEIAVFTRVAQAGGFTAAAKTLGMPKSTVSRKISALEERLGVRLLQRTTRKLGLTDAGRTYLDYGARIVLELEAAERAVGSLQERPRGLLRVTTPLDIAWLGDLVADYLRRNAEVQLELLATARMVDLVEERFDLGIRAGALADSTLIARPLGAVTWVLVATPAYLKKRRRPRAPADLAEHDCVLFGAASPSQLRLERGGATEVVAIAPRLLATDFELVGAIARAGLGIAHLPAFRCADDLRAGRLEHVLPEWSSPPTPVHAVYPTARHVSAKVKTFVEHLQARMAAASPWAVP